MSHKLEVGAIFIADAHESEVRGGFEEFLNLLLSGAIPLPPQLFLMGDMFDLLVGEVKHTHKIYQKQIELINTLSQKTQIFYLEGNHDFNLSKLFPHAEVVAYQNQPLVLNNGDILVAHGDIFNATKYKIYTSIIRNSYFLRFLNFFDEQMKGKITNFILEKLSHKRIYKKLQNFDKLAQRRLLVYKSNAKIIIEGHFHQGELLQNELTKYINLSCFASHQSFFIVKSHIDFQFAYEHLRGSNV